MRGTPGLKAYGPCVTALRKYAASLGHTPGRGVFFRTDQLVDTVSWIDGVSRPHKRRCYRCRCETCGAVIEMRESLLGDGFRMVHLGECPNENDYHFGTGI